MKEHDPVIPPSELLERLHSAEAEARLAQALAICTLQALAPETRIEVHRTFARFRPDPDGRATDAKLEAWHRLMRVLESIAYVSGDLPPEGPTH